MDKEDAIYVCVSVCVSVCACSVTQLCPALWDPMDCSLAGSLSVKFSRQEYSRGLPFPTLGDLPDPGIKPVSLESLALAGRFFTNRATWEA